MLFNSYEFILVFLPITLAVYFVLARRWIEVALGWLVFASLGFYGWWNPAYLLLLGGSMGVNFAVGQALSRRVLERHGEAPAAGDRWRLGLGVAFNLALLAYFKYAGFLVESFSAVSGVALSVPNIILPLAISFFTFQQIAYLVDAFRGLTREYSFLHYALFVCFFPQLIAGPIVHHAQMLPQFMQRENLTPQARNIAIGLTIFAIGLFKKTVLADGVAAYATPVFTAAESGVAPTFFVAWGGALAYTFQLYFDFSGYSDMAIGVARLFGVRLPVNFNSPYKATSISDFWRRWHITLSTFLRDYLYIPLGGNRHGSGRRYINLFITMLLGGLWHGAGWTFVLWGGLHGAYLMINHAWDGVVQGMSAALRVPKVLTRSMAWALTFLAVVIAWVFFRAESFGGAMTILAGMSGVHGIAIPNAILARLPGDGAWLEAMGITAYLGGGTDFVFNWLWIIALFPVALFWPNTQEIMAATARQDAARVNTERSQARGPLLRWQPTFGWAFLMAAIACAGVLSLSSVSEFLYFQF